MNVNQLTAHDAHYDSDKMHQNGPYGAWDYALFQALENTFDLTVLYAKREEFTRALWEKGFAIAPLDRQVAIHSGN